MTQTRPIEMYVGLYEGDTKTWYEAYVDIPADTPEDAVEDIAREVLEQQLAESADHVAFYGVLCTLDDEIPEEDETGDVT